MKKLLWIVVLGLLFSENAYSNITVLNCNHLLKEYRYFYIDTDKKSLFVSNKKTEQKLRDLFKK